MLVFKTNVQVITNVTPPHKRMLLTLETSNAGDAEPNENSSWCLFIFKTETDSIYSQLQYICVNFALTRINHFWLTQTPLPDIVFLLRGLTSLNINHNDILSLLRLDAPLPFSLMSPTPLRCCICSVLKHCAGWPTVCESACRKKGRKAILRNHRFPFKHEASVPRLQMTCCSLHGCGRWWLVRSVLCWHVQWLCAS